MLQGIQRCIEELAVRITELQDLVTRAENAWGREELDQTIIALARIDNE